MNEFNFDLPRFARPRLKEIMPAKLHGCMATSVTYQYPVIGATAPLAGQVSCRVAGTVIATADADTTVTITHNLGLSAGDIAAGRPTITLVELLQASGALSSWAVTSITANTIVLTKGVGAGSGNAGPQLAVTVSRPNTATE